MVMGFFSKVHRMTIDQVGLENFDTDPSSVSQPLTGAHSMDLGTNIL